MEEDRSAHIRAIKAIQKKLVGKKLTYREIYTLMDEIANDRLSDVLTTYFVAASFKEGFSTDELYYLTKAMVETGTKLEFRGIVADKHSTGGVAGTRTSLIIVPIIAEAGFIIPKTSSRAITSPAGTADVMEVFAKVTFTPSRIKKIVSEVGGCIVWGGHLGIAPADDAIIDVEEELSFESFDKVIVSIMAKKVAVSATHLVVDIPVGKTMKIRHFDDAEKISKKFKTLGRRFDMEVVTDINQSLEPAGNSVGPAFEAQDALYVLEQKKERPLALEAKALRLAGRLLDICFKTAKIKKNGEEEARQILVSGRALKKFQEIVKAQGGKGDISSANLKIASHGREIKSHKQGKVKNINNYNLNMIAKVLGAPIDKFAGVFLEKKLDEKVDKNEPLAIFFAKDKYKLKEAEVTLSSFPIYEIEA
ncbi:thymidine phosphorylase [Candidatus Roizmanbacteria bacterium]|nr:thymidine phosphorylase [Candidatus Roizmanbacteria bacterium]